MIEVNGARLWARLQALARHGARADGGVDRQALTPLEIEAKRTLIGWAKEAGLTARTDVVGNLFLRRDGIDPPLLIGSHIDTQPTGGKYDGAYGVLAGLAAVEALAEAGITPRRAIEIVAWTNEEGSRFAPGMMGSPGFAGVRDVAEIHARRDAAGISAGEALDAAFAALPELPIGPLGGPVHAYLEPHIEQGVRLEQAGIPIGIVTGLQGKRTFRVTVTGEAAHAGTAPRAARRDALLAASRAVLALEALTADPDDVVRFTIGRFDVSPNAPSVVPEQVGFSIDLRHPDAATLQRLGDAIAPTCAGVAPPCAIAVEELSAAQPSVFDARLQDELEAMAAELNLPAMRLLSSAGHDARFLAPLCPTAMIFIPCAGGVTHHPAESITPGDALAGAQLTALAAARWTA